MEATIPITTGYQVVSVEITGGNGSCTLADDGSGNTNCFPNVTLSAPEGTKVVGGGYSGLGGNPSYVIATPFDTNGPSSDGTAWLFSNPSQWSNAFLPYSDSASYVWGTIYAICMAV